MRRVPAGDQVDRDHVGHEPDVGVLGRSAFERLMRTRGELRDEIVALAEEMGV